MGNVYTGRRATLWRQAVLTSYGTTCHLCGLPGATEADHLIPKSKAPHLMFVVENGRPAHASCNRRRKDRMLSEAWDARW